MFIGATPSAAAETLKKYGAEKIYVVDDADIKDYLVAPKAEVLAQLVEKTSAGRRAASRPAVRARRSPAGSRSRPTPA